MIGNPPPTSRPSTEVRLLTGIALLSTGLLAGAFGYGAANLAPTFDAVPLDTRLSFHAELMTMNGLTMQTAMGCAALSSLALALRTHGGARLLAAAAAALVLASFLITRLGNVPINGRIKNWAATSPPPDHAEILQRWDTYNNLRTFAALVAFILLIALTPSSSGAQNRRRASGRVDGYWRRTKSRWPWRTGDAAAASASASVSTRPHPYSGDR